MMFPRNLLGLLHVAAFPFLSFGFCPTLPVGRTTVQTGLAASSSADDGVTSDLADSVGRRDFVNGLAALAIAGSASVLFSASSYAAEPPTKVLVLGGTGFVGSRVVQRLKSLGVDVVATSRDGRDGTMALDVTSSNVSARVKDLAQGASAVISCIGALGSANDGAINAASGTAAFGAKEANVQVFVYIAIAPEVAEFAEGIDFLQPYMEGKKYSMDAIRSAFSTYTLIEPTFIYGGDEFKVNPPRVAGFYGQFIEGLLSSGPLRAIANIAPRGIIKIALEPPVSVDAVADAAVASALGKSLARELSTYDAIKAAAATL